MPTRIALLPPPIAPTVHGRRVVWRSWRLVPDRLAGGDMPLLTGLLGFPWRSPQIEARCTTQRKASSGLWVGSGWWGSSADLHHSIVPDPGCTCGIYATTDPGRRPHKLMAGRRHPTVSGFVELLGRMLETDTQLRAGRARIVGPLVVELPTRRLPGRRLEARRVVTEPDRYRSIFVASSLGEPAGAWGAGVAEELASRYGCEVRFA